MQLPPYKRPLFKIVVRHMWDRSKLFLRRAGTVILGINILLWFLATYPRSAAIEKDFAARRAALQSTANSEPSALESLDNEEAGEKLRHSFAGRLGRLIEPVISPLCFDWKMGIGIISSFAAREVFVSTMSTVYNVGKAEKTESSMKSLARTIQSQTRPDGTPVYTPLVAVTLMVFYVFALQCVSTVVVVRRETTYWKWPLFTCLLFGALQ